MIPLKSDYYPAMTEMFCSLISKKYEGGYEMKKTLLVLILILVCAVTFIGMGYAEGTSQNITVAMLPLKYFFDGEEKVPPSNQIGFIYNGTTYVPLRFISEALGKNVTWVGKNYSIYIGQPPEGQFTYLEDFPVSKMPITTMQVWGKWTGDVDNYGDQYNHGIYVQTWGDAKNRKDSLTYALDGQYKKFEGTIVLHSDDKNSKQNNKIIVSLDGVDVYVSQPITAGTRPQNFSIDVAGALNMEIRLVDDTTAYSDTIGIVDAKLYE